MSESLFVQGLVALFDVVIEAGCADGRYHNEVTAAGRQYTGIDTDWNFIKSAGIQHPESIFIWGDVQLAAHGLIQALPPPARKLLLFPFNLFGTLQQPEALLRQLSESDTGIAILGYDTSEKATKARRNYYRAAGFIKLCQKRSAMGIGFCSGSCLHSMAYEEGYLIAMGKSCGLQLKAQRFGAFGKVFTREEP